MSGVVALSTLRTVATALYMLRCQPGDSTSGLFDLMGEDHLDGS